MRHQIEGWIAWSTPDAWTVELNARTGFVTMNAPGGHGVLQASFLGFHEKLDPVTRAQAVLTRFASRGPSPLTQLNVVRKGDAALASARTIRTYADGNRLVLVWFAAHADRGVLFIYNTDLQDGLKELSIVSEVVESVGFLTA